MLRKKLAMIEGLLTQEPSKVTSIPNTSVVFLYTVEQSDQTQVGGTPRYIDMGCGFELCWS